MIKDSLGDRMKRYEMATRTVLTPRMPVIIRVDGKAFHTYTRKCIRPFDEKFGDAMTIVAKSLCKQIQGCVFGYAQSDEISLLVHSYKRFNSSAWFNNQVQKMVSVSAGIASATMTYQSKLIFEEARIGVFDSRAFVLPVEEVANYFIWRQRDAIRNSIQMLARSVFSHSECQGRNVDYLRDKLNDHGSPWELLNERWRFGTALVKHNFVKVINDKPCNRPEWIAAAPNFFGSSNGLTSLFSECPNIFESFMETENE